MGLAFQEGGLKKQKPGTLRMSPAMNVPLLCNASNHQ